MAHPGSTLGLLFFGALSVAISGCDTASTYEGCVDPSDPTKQVTDPHNCEPSAFLDQDFRGREVSGTARRGQDGVAGAQLHISPSPILDSDANAITTDLSANQVGFYRATGHIASFYDLMVKLPNGVGGRDDVLLYRGAAARAFEPQLEVPGRTLPRSWTGHVDVRFDAAIPDDHAILFLATGTNVFGVTGDASTGLSVSTLDFTDTATIHAVEYDPAKGLVSASKYGKIDVLSDASNPKSITMHLDPITGSATPQFTLTAPAGFVPGTVDVRVGASGTSDALLVSIPFGQIVTIPVIPNVGYTYELAATRADGATSDSGETFLDVTATTAITVPDPPDVTSPSVLAQITTGDALVASGTGVLEHVFEPLKTGNAGVRILVANSASTTFPDLSVVNEQQTTGAYVWTVRRFSSVTYVEQIAGVNARRYRPFATSAPRSLFVR